MWKGLLTCPFLALCLYIPLDSSPVLRPCFLRQLHPGQLLNHGKPQVCLVSPFLPAGNPAQPCNLPPFFWWECVERAQVFQTSLVDFSLLSHDLHIYPQFPADPGMPQEAQGLLFRHICRRPGRPHPCRRSLHRAAAEVAQHHRPPLCLR